MFALTNQPAKITNHNPSPEQHGEELMLAGVIRLQVTVPASALDAFDTQLQGFLFRPRQSGDAPAQVDIQGGPAAVSRRLPQLEPLSWNEKFTGYTLTIVAGMGLKDPIVLLARTLSKFEIEAMDGGLAKISFNAGGTYESTLVSGELDGQQRREVEITLEPPAADAVAQTTEMFPKAASELGAVGTGKQVLVTALDVTVSQSTHLTTVIASLSDGESVRAGDWAYRPTLDEIAVGIFDELGAGVEFTPAVRADYDRAEAA